jgi:hypothetical protein
MKNIQKLERWYLNETSVGKSCHCFKPKYLPVKNITVKKITGGTKTRYHISFASK